LQQVEVIKYTKREPRKNKNTIMGEKYFSY